jgi:transposase
MPLELLCPDPATWRIAAIAPEQDRLVVHLEPMRPAVACPVCGTRSRRVHSRYRRRPWDVPWAQRPVQLVVHARRFFCDAPGCPRRIFVEPFPGILAPYARQTERWREALWEFTHASSAEVAARVARLLGYRASPDTLIRRQRAEPIAVPSPRVLGVDEFARRRGSTYGTLWVDLEQRRPIAVLEGRTAKPFTAWLQAHPPVAILVRDRANASALAGRQAVPDALQVANRCHLVRHVSDALKALLHSRQWCQPATVPQPAQLPPSDATITVRLAETPQAAPQPTPRKRAVWEAVQQHRNLGQSLRQIARVVGLERRTVRRYLAADQPPVYPARRPRPTQLTPYLGYLAERWAQGCHKARRLSHALVQRGYRGSESMVRVIVRPWRTGQPASRQELPPSRLARLLLQPARRLTEAEQQALEGFLHANPRLAQGYQLKTRFQTLLVERDPAALDQWLQEAESADLPPFRTVAHSFRQDDDAVRAALTTPWSTGQCEGQICRVKLITRLGYGRAKLDLLQQRLWHRMAMPGSPVMQRWEVEQPAGGLRFNRLWLRSLELMCEIHAVRLPMLHQNRGRAENPQQKRSRL